MYIKSVKVLIIKTCSFLKNTTNKKYTGCCFDLCVGKGNRREERFVIGIVQKWAVPKDSIKLFLSVHDNDLDCDF